MTAEDINDYDASELRSAYGEPVARMLKEIAYQLAVSNERAEVYGSPAPAALTDDQILRFAFDAFPTDTYKHLTVNRWKDGIEVTYPLESLRKFVAMARRAR